MRVLQVIHYYPPETPGGTQSYVASAAALLKAAGHEVAVVAGARAHSETGEVIATDESGVPTRRILRDLRTEALSGDAGSERIEALVEEAARDFAPDVVHVHHWHALSRGIVQRLKGLGYPVVLTLHDLFVTCPRHFRMPDARRFCANTATVEDCAACLASDAGGVPAEALAAMILERTEVLADELAAADAVVVMSVAQRDLLRTIAGFSPGEMRVLPIGIPVEGPRPTPPAPEAGRLRVVNWAGLDPRKGTHVLLDAVAGSGRRNAFEVHLYGRDGDADYMEELRERGEGLDVLFHGAFEDEDRHRFGARYDVAVFPFLAFETHAMTVDEALHLGLPVVVSDCGAPPERVGSAGLVFPRNDAVALRALLERLLDEPERLEALRSGRHGARDLRDHVGELVELYANLAG